MAVKYGVPTFKRTMVSFMEFGERTALAELGKLSKGTFELSEPQDDGRTYNVKVTITDDEFLVDLRDNPDQDDGPTNICRNGTIVCAQMVFKSLTDPDTPANDGSFRPLKVLTREGLVFHAQKRGAIGFYFETDQGFLTAGYTRSLVKPWSLEGRADGSGNFVEIDMADGETQRTAFVSGFDVTSDDVIRVITSCGACYGDPKNRAPEAMQMDIKNGYVTPERVAKVYGI